MKAFRTIQPPLTRSLRPATSSRYFSLTRRQCGPEDVRNPPKGNPPVPGRGPPFPPKEEAAALSSNAAASTYLGTTKRLPEFNLHDKVICVTGAARGLGLVQAEALLEAGATVYALDRLDVPSPDFARIQRRAAEELGGTLHYRQIDVRDNRGLNQVIRDLSDAEGRLDGLLAAAGIQQETPALEYTAKDANTMFEVNVTGVFMTAQAVAREMIRHGNGGSMAFIASMSGSVANRVRIIIWARVMMSAITDNKNRASYARPITHRKQRSYNSPAIWRRNGAHTASESTPSVRDTS